MIPTWSFSAVAKAPTLFKITKTKTTVLMLHLQQVENYSELTQVQHCHLYAGQITLKRADSTRNCRSIRFENKNKRETVIAFIPPHPQFSGSSKPHPAGAEEILPFWKILWSGHDAVLRPLFHHLLMLYPCYLPINFYSYSPIKWRYRGHLGVFERDPRDNVWGKHLGKL